MRVEIRSDSVLIEGYVNAVARDSRPIRNRATGAYFVEQIVPGAFRRALTHNEVDLLLNHENSRKLGSTATNLMLTEDSIGLRARVEITDQEVMEKARKHQLRGWSFGFLPMRETTEQRSDGMERRFVQDMKLVEVSLIDQRKLPCYEGTSVEARSDGETVLTPDPMETEVTYTVENQRAKDDPLAKYKERMNALRKEHETCTRE